MVSLTLKHCDLEPKSYERTLQATEEILLAKIRLAVQDALDAHNTERRLTMIEFVEHFDARDSFVQRLMGLLVQEYSERKTTNTQINRRLQISSRTSKALEAILRDATIYDESRTSRWGRSRHSSSWRVAPMDENSPTADGYGEEEHVTSRDRLFQNALSELEDGEFGARWHSNLNEAYAENDTSVRWGTSERIRPILHDVDMASSWHVATEPDEIGRTGMPGWSASSSSHGSDLDGQGQETLSRIGARLEAETNALESRLGLPRMSLVRRHSLRRRASARTSTAVDGDTTLRRRLMRSIGERDDEPSIAERGISSRGRGTLGAPYHLTAPWEDIAEGEPSGATLRRLWADHHAQTSAAGSSSAAAGSQGASQWSIIGQRSLRRGGLRPPESILETSRRNPDGILSTSTPRAGTHSIDGLETLVAPSGETSSGRLVATDADTSTWLVPPRTWGATTPLWNLGSWGVSTTEPLSTRVRWDEDVVAPPLNVIPEDNLSSAPPVPAPVVSGSPPSDERPAETNPPAPRTG